MVPACRWPLISAAFVGKRIANGDRRPPSTPIELVCVSTHGGGGPSAAPTDVLKRVDGRWAWCPRGGRSAHQWQQATAGSLNAMRDQLAELSRLVGVALATPAKPGPASSLAPVKPKPRSLSTRTKPKR